MMAHARLQKQALLPPRSPFPAAAAPPHAELGPIARPRDAPPHRHGHHQRTSSESVLIDEQPSWLDDLLDEPESPARAPHGRPGHRRSASDSLTLFDGAAAGMHGNVFDGMRGGGRQGVPWVGAPEFFPEPSSFGQVQPWDPRQMLRHGGGGRMPVPMGERNGGHHCPPNAFGGHEHGSLPNGVDRRGHGDAASHDQRIGAERKDGEQLAHPQSEADTKRAKQQYAQRSRVRKLQYIGELERTVQALQTEGIKVSAEMDFLGQQNIMLDLENKTLKQRLESLSQEQLIKHFQQEMFEREIGRLRSLFQQQQQHVPQQQAPTHSRRNSRDLDSQFANLSLKHSDNNSGRDAVPGLHI